MTGRLQMRNRELTGIPTPLDSEKDHAANVDYIRRKKRSLEVVVGGNEEDNNNGGGTEGGGESGGGSGGSGSNGGENSGSGEGSGSGSGSESGSSSGVNEGISTDSKGDKTFTLGKNNLEVKDIIYNYSLPWAEKDYTPTLEEMKSVIQLHRFDETERYTKLKMFVPGILKYTFSFDIRQGEGSIMFADNYSYTEKTRVKFSTMSLLNGFFEVNPPGSYEPSSIGVVNPLQGDENKLNGSWSWQISFTVKKADLPSSF